MKLSGARMKVLERIFLIMAIILVVLGVVAYLLPSKWEVSRSIQIEADSVKIYPLVASLRNWPQWTPWTSEQDPTLHYNYSGAVIGEGAKQSWVSDNMGNGTLIITSASAQEGVKYDLFFDSHEPATGEILFSKKNNGTLVTWTDRGQLGNNPINRYFGLVLEFMLGKEFEDGLNKLKSLVEK